MRGLLISLKEAIIVCGVLAGYVGGALLQDEVPPPSPAPPRSGAKFTLLYIMQVGKPTADADAVELACGV